TGNVVVQTMDDFQISPVVYNTREQVAIPIAVVSVAGDLKQTVQLAVPKESTVAPAPRPAANRSSMPDKMIRCPEGHFFDPAKHNACPWCALPSDFGREQKTRPVAGAPPPIPGPPPPLPGAMPAAAPSNAGKTVRVGMETKQGLEPVVGWLVCVSGPDRGRDFRLHGEKNYIGRSPAMDVVIQNDNSVSREKHGIVVFDPRKKSFWTLPGDASGLVYLNGEVVYSPTEMKPDDALELGQTKLVLAPFCGEKYSWDEAAGA
ncbi:MAG TPA: FHA domain-containing protein, partial [Bryobacteraceae bacterium]|nr:FHA domain-containing protein [Bryobacteraceae bacterium]